MPIRRRIDTVFAQRRKWRDFLDFAEARGSPQWLFRGVADSEEHLLQPKIGRMPSLWNLGTERLLFGNFKRRARQFVGSQPLSDWDFLALGQHHGLPTRLLDWSTNPLVAAFFAVSSEPRRKTCRIYAYRVGDVIDPDRQSDPFAIDDVAVYIPSSIAPRIVAQRGVFTAHPDPTTPLSIAVGQDDNHFDIDAEDRSYFERRLFGMAIDPSVIGADLDGLCKTLNWQYERGVALGKVVF